MRREDFHAQLLAASFSALRFGQKYLTQTLAIDVQYVAFLNQSHDKNREPDEIVYPQDDNRVVKLLSEDGVVDLLYRDGRCPQWIDISVAASDEKNTLLQLVCCGRFHSNESRLYYYDTGLQPFGIKSPMLPPGYKEDGKFNIKTPTDYLKELG